MRDNLKQVGATENVFYLLWMCTAQEGGIAPIYTLAIKIAEVRIFC